jgi:hypothetical protein
MIGADQLLLVPQNETASETTYTIFCPSSETETRPACGLALDFPFIIVGGPDTIMFHGTVTSMLYVLWRPVSGGNCV